MVFTVPLSLCYFFAYATFACMGAGNQILLLGMYTEVRGAGKFIERLMEMCRICSQRSHQQVMSNNKYTCASNS